MGQEQEALRESRASDQEARALLATLQHQHKESAEREKTFQATIETLCAENEELKRIQQEHTSYAELHKEIAELKNILIQQGHMSCAELHEERAELKTTLAAIHDNG